jgi:hypothetical protein
MNYLSNPSISNEDTTIQMRLKSQRSDFSMQGMFKLKFIEKKLICIILDTHDLAKEIMRLLEQ